MNPLETDAREETVSFCRERYPEFGSTVYLLERYRHAAQEQERDRFAGLPAVSRQTTEPGGHGCMSAAECGAYLDGVFRKVFRDRPDAAREICCLAENLADTGNTGTIASTELPEALREWSDLTPLQPDFLTLMAALAGAHLYRHRHAGSIPDEPVQNHPEGVCPECGLRPHYGILTGSEGNRELECWLCRTRWQFPRIECPHCGETEQEKLGYFFVSDIPECRIHFCHSCRRYVKIYDLRKESLEDPNLWILHLATLDCDDAAHMEGFDPASGLYWHDAAAADPEEEISTGGETLQ